MAKDYRLRDSHEIQELCEPLDAGQHLWYPAGRLGSFQAAFFVLELIQSQYTAVLQAICTKF